MARWVCFLFCTVALAQVPQITQISDGASFLSGVVAPGSIASVFGADLAVKTETAKTLPLPTNLGNASVSICFNGEGQPNCEQAPLFYVSPSQINLLIPSDFGKNQDTILYGLTFTVAVNGVEDVDSARGSPQGVELYYIQPEIFELGFDCWFQTEAADPDACVLNWSPSGETGPLPFRAAVTDQKGHAITSKNPARIGPTYTMWLTGMGVNPISLATVTMSMQVPAYGYSSYANASLAVDYAGPSPQFIGLYQINFRLPPSILGFPGTGPNAYPPLWPCAEYKWDQTFGLNQQGEWEQPNINYGGLNLPILIEPVDAPCAGN